MDQTSDPYRMADSASVPKSSYLQYLPAIYSEHGFWGRFLHIFEDILEPIEEKIGQIEYYLDMGYTPHEFVSWLASWMDIHVPPNVLPSSRSRKLIPELAQVYCRRGTRSGLKDHIKSVFGTDAGITESRKGMVLGASTFLGDDTVLSSGAGRNHFIVTLVVEKSGDVDKGLLQRIVDVHCPAHATYSVEIRSQQGPG